MREVKTLARVRASMYARVHNMRTYIRAIHLPHLPIFLGACRQTKLMYRMAHGPSLVRATLCGIHQLIVAEPFETPEHNRLQMRFLNDEFCWNQPSASFADLGQRRREFTFGKASWSMPQINASRA